VDQHLDALGRDVEQPARLITSSPLFIMVAESTEILRPITSFGCAHGLLGSHAVEPGRRKGAERPAGGGQHDARTERSGLRKALKYGVVLAVDGQHLAPASCAAAHE